MRAVISRKTASVSALLKLRANASIIDNNGDSVLHHLPMYNRMERLHTALITAFQGDPHAANFHGIRPIILAAKEHTNPRYIKGLLKKEFIDRTKHGNITAEALHVAIKYAKFEIVQYLTKLSGFDVNLVEENKDTFIYVAVKGLILRKKDSFKIMRWILRMDPALDFINSRNQSVQQLIEEQNCSWVADKIREACRLNVLDVEFKDQELGNLF